MILEDVRYRAWYTHDRALVAVGQMANRPPSGHQKTDGFGRTDSQSARALCTQTIHVTPRIQLVGLRRSRGASLVVVGRRSGGLDFESLIRAPGGRTKPNRFKDAELLEIGILDLFIHSRGPSRWGFRVVQRGF